MYAIRSYYADGFFRTGDLGRLTLGGELVITGRAKEIIVLASGENIDPTRIENTISMFPFVQDAILVGQDKKGLGALVVPNMEELLDYVGKKFSDLKKEKAELLADRNVIDHIKKEMNRLLMPVITSYSIHYTKLYECWPTVTGYCWRFPAGSIAWYSPGF